MSRDAKKLWIDNQPLIELLDRGSTNFDELAGYMGVHPATLKGYYDQQTCPRFIIRCCDSFNDILNTPRANVGLITVPDKDLKRVTDLLKVMEVSTNWLEL